MSDLISRRDAITAYCEHECGIKGMTRENCGATDCGTIFDDIPSAQQWIPCSERLPNLNEDGVSDMVLLCWSDGQMTVGAYQGNRTFVGQAWPMARDCRVTVIAWMPLPEPYKGGK